MHPRWLGLLPLAFFGIHGSRYILTGTPHEILWACTMSNLLMGIGILASAPRVIASALLWLPIGNVLWVYDAIHTQQFLWTSTLTHCGGLLVGLAALRRLGFPRFSCVTGVLSGMSLQLLSRFVTPYQANVNVSQFVYPGSESLFPSYTVYFAATWGLWTATFVLVELLCRSVLRDPSLTGRVEHRQVGASLGTGGGLREP